MSIRFLAAFSLLASSALADTIILDNGDRISGDILKVEEGRLSMKTDYAGVVQISWKRVSEFASQDAFAVETASGLLVKGSILRSQDELAIVNGEARTPITADALVRATPIAPDSAESFWSAIEGSADLGYSFSRGNISLNQSSLNVSTRYRRDGYKVQIDLGSLFARQAGAPGASRHSGALRFDRFLTPDAFAFGNLGFERDERRSLNLRTVAGGGLGWKVVKAAQRELSLLGGINLVNEQFRLRDGATPPTSSGEGQFGLDWRTIAAQGVQFSTKLAITPNLVQLGRYRIAIESGARVPLIGRHIWSVNVFNRYDSRPPVEAARSDYGAISSLGVNF